ncbi:hypothetical protein SM0020_05627 [Sinorhizobium meliloti CCNWSX0020]|uniref:Transmembrane protein n=1 Tax=Sinorhizobium meliloti CCNWSX0020 TaxID=1107881 RepID=H0FVJ6_RHIML|nr:hypothetical protein SM0020_05627 [Sinorhizobium meliloti CCNWSX0020]
MDHHPIAGKLKISGDAYSLTSIISEELGFPWRCWFVVSELGHLGLLSIYMCIYIPMGWISSVKRKQNLAGRGPGKIEYQARWFYEVTNLSTWLGLVDALGDFSPAAHGDPAR